jgi:ribonucleoside-diphosphate reductase alpha chain
LNSVSNQSAEQQAASAAALHDQALAEAEGAVCTLRPGDDGFEECEACQ